MSACGWYQVSSVAGRDLVTPRTVTLVTRAIVIVRLSGEGEAGRGQWTVVNNITFNWAVTLLFLLGQLISSLDTVVFHFNFLPLYFTKIKNTSSSLSSSTALGLW